MSRTSPKPIRQRQTELTKRSIVEALAEIIVEEGPLGFAVQNVADRAGVAHRTVYRHFPNREAMCEGLVEWTEQRWRERGHEGLPTTLEGYIARIPEAFEEFESDRMLYRSMLLLNLSTGFRGESARLRDRLIDQVVGEVAPSLSESEREPAAVLIRYLGSSLTWMNLTSQFRRSDVEAAKAATYGMRLVLEDLKRRERKAKRK